MPVPVHLVCGFLGAGKTTLLRRLLASQPSQERLAVLVNEFGKLGIDGRLLEGFDSTVRELAGGCICCELRLNFVSCLQDILHAFSPDRIVVETTGLADPADIVAAVEDASAGGALELASLITVVDCELFSKRDMFGASYFNQIKAADLLLLNKTDLLEPEEVVPMSEELARLNPRARIMPVVHCAVDREIILDPLPGSERPRPPAPARLDQGLESLAAPSAKLGHTGQGDDGFLAFSFQDPRPLDRGCLEKFLSQLPWQVFRVKGFVRLEQGGLMLNYTYRRPEFQTSQPPEATNLAFVAWQVEPEDILLRLRQCLNEST